MTNPNRISRLQGIPPFFFIVANLCFWLIPLIGLIFLKMILPFNKPQEAITSLMGTLYTLAVWCDDLLLLHVMGIELDVRGQRKEYPEKFYIVTANHQSWIDILILQHLFNRRAPVLKFLVKREVMYLPLVGLICWAYGYPFLRRYSAKSHNGESAQRHRDLAILEKALNRFMRYPATVINFAEGTRFTPAKARRQKSPYKYLLKPKAGGLTTMLGILGDRVGAVLDVTIVYDGEDPTFWNFLCGKFNRVLIRLTEYSTGEISQVSDFETVATWINGIWEKKDLEIGSIRQGLDWGHKSQK